MCVCVCACACTCACACACVKRRVSEDTTRYTYTGNDDGKIVI